MKFNFALLIILSFFSTYLNSQNYPEGERSKKVKRLFSYSLELFKKKDYVFNKIDFTERDYYYRTVDENKIKEYLDFINKSLKLEIIKDSNTSGFSALSLTINLPDFFEDLNNYRFKELYHEQIDIENIYFDLVDEFNNKIKLSYIDKEFSSKKIIYTRLFAKDTNHQSESINLKGEIKYEIKFLTNYDIIEVSLDQIGKNFKLGNSSYKLIDYFNNNFIIKNLSGPPQEEICIVNLTSDGKLTKPYPYSEFKNLKKIDSSFVDKVNFYNVKTSGIPEFLYEIFKKDPNISLEEFDKLVTLEKLDELKENNPLKRIIMLPTVSNLNSKYILYTPQYKSKIIEIKK